MYASVCSDTAPSVEIAANSDIQLRVKLATGQDCDCIEVSSVTILRYTLCVY